MRGTEQAHIQENERGLFSSSGECFLVCCSISTLNPATESSLNATFPEYQSPFNWNLNFPEVSFVRDLLHRL